MTTPANGAGAEAATLLDCERLTLIKKLYTVERRAELFRLFERQTADTLGQLRRAVTDRKRSAVATNAHRLTSSAANFACGELRETAFRLAHPAVEPSWEVIEQELKRAEALFPLTLEALEDALGIG